MIFGVSKDVWYSLNGNRVRVTDGILIPGLQDSFVVTIIRAKRVTSKVLLTLCFNANSRIELI